MKVLRIPRHRAAVLLGLLLGSVLLVAPAQASTGPAVWFDHQPAPGAAVADSTPLISVEVYDPAEVDTRFIEVKVDGLIVKHSATWKVIGGHWEDDGCDSYWVVDYDKRYATISYTPSSPLAEGAHSVWMKMSNRSGVYSYESWSFTVGLPPILSNQYPADRSTCETDAPTISAEVENADGATARVFIDGQEITATVDAVAGVVTAPVTQRLGNDASHDVTMTVATSNGSDTLSWRFDVQIYAPMPVAVSGCDICHVGYPDIHPLENCESCHGDGAPVAGIGITSGSSEGHPTDVLADCGSCHGEPYVTVPPMHLFSDDSYHVSSTACGDCHVGSLSIEHHRYTDGAGATLTCETCHTNANPYVSATIWTGLRQCAGCHTTAHGLNLVLTMPDDIPLMPGFEWSAPQRAGLWEGEPWLPEEYAVDGYVVFSDRSISIDAQQTWAYYQSELSARGWSLLSDAPLADATAFEALFGKEDRRLLLRYYTGSGHQLTSENSPEGGAVDLVFR